MNKLYICFCFFLATALGSSCGDYLDVKSNASLAVPNSLENLQMLLDDGNTMNFSTNSFAEASADDYFVLSTSFNALVENARRTYVWENNSYYFDNDWAAGYVPVYNANITLDQLRTIERQDRNRAEWDNIRGSALFFRGHAFLTQLWAYGKAYDETSSDLDLGIVLRLSSDPDGKSSRATVSECYEQVLSDLTEAIPLLRDDVSGNLFRPSRAAAYGLLARTYHSMNDFTNASRYADSTLALKSDILDYNDVSEVNLNASFPFKRFNKETIFYTQMRSYQPSLGASFALIDTNLYAAYSDNDLRKRAFFARMNSGYYRFKGSYAAASNYFTGITTAEIKLIKAESLVQLGSVEEGLAEMEILLKNRMVTGTHQPDVILTRSEGLQYILMERRKELLMRGLRWMDVKRQNILGMGISLSRNINGQEYRLESGDTRFALPLPQDIVDYTGVEQNYREGH